MKPISGIVVACSVCAGQQIIQSHTELAIILSFVSAMISAIITFLKPAEKANDHQRAGTEFVRP